MRSAKPEHSSFLQMVTSTPLSVHTHTHTHTPRTYAQVHAHKLAYCTHPGTFPCDHIHIHMHMHIHIHIHIYIHIRIHTFFTCNIYTCTHTHLHIYTQTPSRQNWQELEQLRLQKVPFGIGGNTFTFSHPYHYQRHTLTLTHSLTHSLTNTHLLIYIYSMNILPFVLRDIEYYNIICEKIIL